MRHAIRIAVLCLLASQATAQQAAVKFDLVVDGSLRSRVQQALPQHIGAAVLVRIDGETVFKEVYGSRRLGEPSLVTTSTAFRLAAATKPFTAAAVLKLAEEGKLEPTDRLGRFFDGLPAATADITVEQLLTHSSGLPQYYHRLSDTNAPEQADGERYFTEDDVLGWLTTDSQLLFSPGSSTVYCDTNYVVLALVVEQASEMAFEDYLQEHILEPAGMNDAAVLVAGKREPAERAYGHNRLGGQEPFPRAAIDKLTGDERVKALGQQLVEALTLQVIMKSRGYEIDDQSTFSRMRGDGCLYASIDDMEAWFETLDSGDLFSEDFLRLMKIGLVDADAGRTLQYVSTRSFSCGWLRDQFDGQTRLTNPGATRGFCQTVQWLPETETAVVVLVNTDGEWEIDSIGERVLELVADDRDAQSEAAAE